MTENSGRIVITGIGVVSPYGAGLQNLENGLLEGKCRLQQSTGFYPGFAGTLAQVCDTAGCRVPIDTRQRSLEISALVKAKRASDVGAGAADGCAL